MSAPMLRRSPPVAVALVVWLMTVPAHAQIAGEPTDRAGAVVPHAEISASTDNSTASLALELGKSVYDVQTAGDVLHWRYDQLSLTVSTPFNGKDDAAPATLDGLANGTKATLRYGRFAGASRLSVAQDFEALVKQALAKCLVVETSPTNLEECENASTQGNQLWLIRQYLPDSVRRALEAQIPAGTIDWGIEASIGYRQFEFVDATTLVPGDEQKLEVGGKLFATWYPVDAPLALMSSVAYQRAFEAPDDVVLCPAGTGSTPVTCVAASPGSPTLDESLLLAGGIRFRLGDGGGAMPPLAIAPLVTYDALDDVVGIDVPIYFLRDEKSGLTGGVRVGWRSDEENLLLGIFVGSAFGIFD